MKVIGITGGVGAGKSQALQYMQEKWGAYVCYADNIGHELQQPGEPCYQRIVETFGAQILEDTKQTDGKQIDLQQAEVKGNNVKQIDDRQVDAKRDNTKQIDRKKLATIIFSQEKKRLALNAIMHPCIKERICELIRIEAKRGTKYFLLEAALLIEEAYEQICDELWYIYAPKEKRRQRLEQTRGYTQDKIEQIFASQLSDTKYREHCKVIIDNSEVVERMYEQIDALENSENETM
jgi:dephospho-CoA kinase